MKFDVIISARGNSKGIPNKNKRKLGNMTLVERCVRKAKLSKYVGRILLSSEDRDILQQGSEAGATYLHHRCAKFSEDHVRQVSVIDDLLNSFEREVGRASSSLILLQTTTPFLTWMDLNTCVEEFMNRDCEQIISGHIKSGSPSNYYISHGDSNNIIPLYPASRRQLQPKLYHVNGGIRIFSKEHFQRTTELFDQNKKISVYKNLPWKSLNLDEMSDWNKAVEELKNEHTD